MNSFEELFATYGFRAIWLDNTGYRFMSPHQDLRIEVDQRPNGHWWFWAFQREPLNSEGNVHTDKRFFTNKPKEAVKWLEGLGLAPVPKEPEVLPVT